LIYVIIEARRSLLIPLISSTLAALLQIIYLLICNSGIYYFIKKLDSYLISVLDGRNTKM